MTLGVGVFNNPLKFAGLGLIQGIVYFIVAVFLTYYTFNIIFEASYITGKNNISDIVEHYLGSNFKKIINFTLIIDYSASLIFYSLLAGDLYKMLIIEFDIFKIPENPFDSFNIKLWGIFYIVYYLAINFLLFKK